MNKLTKVKLSDVADIIGGGTPDTKKQEFWNGDIPWITPKDLSGYNYRYISNGERNITEKGLENSSARIIPQGSILLTSRAPIGYIAIAQNNLCTNQGFKSLILKENNSPLFFYYLLKNNIKYIINMSSGSTFPEISGSQVKNLEFNIPDLPTQEKIARVLSSLDDKIELNNKINQNLEQQAQAIFKSWFVDFEPFGGKMPKDWKVGKLGELAQITSGKRPRLKQADKDDNFRIPIIGASTIMGYTNTVLYNEPILITGRVGTHGIINKYNKQCWPSDNTLVIKSKYYEYIYQQLKQIDFAGLNRGSTQPLITQKDLLDITIVIPTSQKVKEFEQFATQLNAYQDNLITENEKLKQLRDTLLPKLMSGEIDVDKVEV